MERNCDNCGKVYKTKPADIKRGWGLTCSKKCAAEKREKGREDYNEVTVTINNLKREQRYHKYSKLIEQTRKKNPNMSDIELWNHLYKLTNDEIFLPKVAQDVFLF